MSRTVAGLVLTVAVCAGVLLYPPEMRRVRFPGGKAFAFTIVDDTDQATLERIKPLYDVMADAGLRTTKTVWVGPASDEPVATNQGESLRDAGYRDYLLELQKKGFEIALHNVRGGSSTRAEIIDGLDQFKSIVGRDPSIQVNHAVNRENLYWGKDRWTVPVFRWAFALTRSRDFTGQQADSPHFWGDVARQRIKYLRRFTFTEINLLKVNPTMPYRLQETPYVNYWFENSDGGSINAFERLLSPANLDALEREGGVSIVYAHLGAGSFNRDGKADPRFVARIRDVASRNGWFAPATEILDHLASQPGWRADLTWRERVRLETLYLTDWIF